MKDFEPELEYLWVDFLFCWVKKKLEIGGCLCFIPTKYFFIKS